MEATFKIYAIGLKRTKKYVYVGATVWPVYQRFMTHTCGSTMISKRYKRQSLFYVTLESNTEILPEREEHWIKKLRYEGHPLLNTKMGKYPANKQTIFHFIKGRTKPNAETINADSGK